MTNSTGKPSPSAQEQQRSSVVTARVITDPDETASIEAGWDRLAVECGRPFCAPAWMLPWWTHAAPVGAQLRIIAVEERETLIGIASLFAHRSRTGVIRYRFLTSGLSKYLEPLSAAGREEEVATKLAKTLSDASPRPDLVVFDGVPVDSRWPALLRRHWPSSPSPWEKNAYVTPAPFVTLAGATFDEWWASRSGRWRRDIGRRRRHLGEHSVEFRLQKGADVAHHVDDFVRLHKARWVSRGGSLVITRGVDDMLVEAVGLLAESGRLRLWTMEASGRSVSSHLFVAAGGEVTYWLGGFDEAWGWCSPAIQVILEAVRHSWEAGDARFNLGTGGQPYKYLFANGEELLHWSQIAPRGRRYARTRVALAPSQFRGAVAARLPENARQRIKRGMAQITRR